MDEKDQDLDERILAIEERSPAARRAKGKDTKSPATRLPKQ